MRMYVAEVNGKALLVFPYDGPLMEACCYLDSEESDLRIGLRGFEGQDGRPLYEEGDSIMAREATNAEQKHWRLSARAAEEEMKSEGWSDDFEATDHVAFLVPAKMIGQDDDEEAA